MFESEFRLCCDWLCKVGAYCFAVFVDDWCLNLMFGYVVLCYVNLLCVWDLPFLLMIGV